MSAAPRFAGGVGIRRLHPSTNIDGATGLSGARTGPAAVNTTPVRTLIPLRVWPLTVLPLYHGAARSLVHHNTLLDLQHKVSLIH